MEIRTYDDYSLSNAKNMKSNKFKIFVNFMFLYYIVNSGNVCKEFEGLVNKRYFQASPFLCTTLSSSVLVRIMGAKDITNKPK